MITCAFKILNEQPAMDRRFPASHRFRMVLALIFAGSTLLYNVLCGHIPPLRMRRDGSVERLAPTATVIGMFEDWEGSVAQIQLERGDILAVFSDGITEAAHDEEEFGEA
jgi:serine phosphatase RsbU (regulator of sigma subunit)